MELLIKPYQMPERIEFNFDELKTALIEKVREYETAIYSEDQIKQAKADKAALNKLKKALNDERIKREKEYMIPFADFKAKINEIISIIDKPITAIDEQVRAFDEKQKMEKAEAIRAHMACYSLPYGINLEKIFDQRWLNASMSMTAIKKAIDDKVTDIQDDLETLENLDEYQDFAIAYYRETMDIRATLNEIKRQKEFRARQKQIEEEREKASKQKEAESPKKEAPEKPKEEAKKEVDALDQEKGQWIAFQAYLIPETALKLKRFLEENDIPFRRA